MKTINKVILSPADRNCSGARCVNKVEVLSYGRPQGSGRQSGFTLVELLVVVLIIGILSAIAIPMYQGAVDKSHWSTMLPASKAIKDAEEAFKMTNGEYSDTMEHLDVQINNDDLTFTLSTPNTLADPNVIRVTNSKLDNVRLASYLDDSPMFAGQLHCEAKNEGSDPNERGQRLCEKLLNGQYLKTTDDGYTRYLLDQSVDASTCKAATGSWSTSKTTCYKDDTTRCEALGGMQVISDGQCGVNNGNGQTFGAETICNGTTGGCDGAKIENGGECVTWGGDHITNNTPCWGAKIKDGGICRVKEKSYVPCGSITVEAGGMCIDEAGGGCGFGSTIKGAVVCKKQCRGGNNFDGGVCVDMAGGSCGESTFKNGATCYALVKGGCGKYTSYASENAYEDTSCCCGTYCPDSAPKCAASRCDPYYMDPNNFKDL